MGIKSSYVKGTRLLKTFDPGRCKTEQAHKQDCDINFILKRYRKTGVLPQYQRVPQFGDAIKAGDFQKSMDIIATGKTAFEGLPAKIRQKFRNDPRLWLESVEKHIAADQEVKNKIKAEVEEKKKSNDVPSSPPPPSSVKDGAK